jgi:transcriptional regulator with XRE-family HTH domain
MTDIDQHRRRFGANVRRLRREHKFSQEKLGILLGTEVGTTHPVRRQEIIRYEQGHRYPSLAFRIGLANVLGVSLATLDEDAPPPAPIEDQDPAA